MNINVCLCVNLFMQNILVTITYFNYFRSSFSFSLTTVTDPRPVTAGIAPCGTHISLHFHRESHHDPWGGKPHRGGECYGVLSSACVFLLLVRPRKVRLGCCIFCPQR